MDSSLDAGYHKEIAPLEVSPLDSNEGSPHLVIEYLRKDTGCRLSERDLKLNKANSWGSEKHEAVYDHMRDCFTASQIEISCDDI